MSYPTDSAINEIETMDEHRILLKAKTFQRWSMMTHEDYNRIKDAIKKQLLKYGYEYKRACCGKFTIGKIGEDNAA